MQSRQDGSSLISQWNQFLKSKSLRNLRVKVDNNFPGAVYMHTSRIGGRSESNWCGGERFTMNQGTAKERKQIRRIDKWTLTDHSLLLSGEKKDAFGTPLEELNITC